MNIRNLLLNYMHRAIYRTIATIIGLVGLLLLVMGAFLDNNLFLWAGILMIILVWISFRFSKNY